VPARLHHELIGRGEATRWLLLTHGIYGAGGNWRSIARKLVERQPAWGVVLVDLRHHGRSDGGAPPHTLAACAEDLLGLVATLAATPIRALAGHSFGGKVVLAARADAPRDLLQSWVLDSTPSPRPAAATDPHNSVRQVLELMEGMPPRWARRDEFVAAVRAAGHADGLAQWLALNLVPAASGEGLVLRLELAAIRAMLDDYYAQDLWSAVEDPALPGTVELVIADRSSTLSAADRARLAHPPAHVHVHHLDAGHWLHIEAGPAVVELLAAGLPTEAA
jgi:pimeloyl-ACP methyl ester carboxylesterase